MSVIVGGGTGFVGRTLAALFKQKGAKVICVSRVPEAHASNNFDDIISWHQLKDKGLPEDCKAVINLAGENLMSYTRRWNAAFEDDLVRSRVETTKTFRDLILESKKKPKAFLTSSGVGFYKASNTTDYDEYSEGGSHDFLARLTKKWEEASELPSNSGVRVCNVRTAAVIGRDGGVIKNMYWPFFFGMGGRVGDGQQPFPWIHIEDLANIFWFLMENDKCTGKYNGAAPQIINNAQFTASLARVMRRPAIFPAPVFALNAALGRERASVITQGQRVHPKRLLDAGYEFLFTNIDDALKDVLAANRSSLK